MTQQQVQYQNNDIHLLFTDIGDQHTSSNILETPHIRLHAMVRHSNSKTLRVTGKIKKKKLTILMDGGSTAQVDNPNGWRGGGGGEGLGRCN